METVKRIMFFVVFFGIVLLAGMFEDVDALMSDVAPLQHAERGQDIQITRSVWIMQPAMRTKELQPTYENWVGEIQGSTYEY